MKTIRKKCEGATMLVHYQSLILLLGIFLMVGYGLYQTHIRGKIPHIRRIAALEAIDEAIGRAMETGKKVHCGLTHVEIFGAYAIQSLASFALASYWARKAAEYGVPAIYTTDTIPSYPIYEGLIRDAYVSAGKLEDFNDPHKVQIRVMTGPYDLAVAGVLQRENVGAGLISGEVGRYVLQFGEAHRVADAFSIIGMPIIDKLEWSVATFDYVFMLSETYAAGAWITKDKTQLGHIIGSDIATWVAIILFIAFFVVANILGSPLTFLGR